MSFLAIIDIRLVSFLGLVFLILLSLWNDLDDDEQPHDIEEDHSDDPAKGYSDDFSFSDSMVVVASGCPCGWRQAILVQTHNLNYSIFTIRMQSAGYVLLLFLLLRLFLSNYCDLKLRLSAFFLCCCWHLFVDFRSLISFFCLLDAE